ncbi:MAG: LuxR C-terminal-related transcriptional regulator [Anaerolineae bacterium]
MSTKLGGCSPELTVEGCGFYDRFMFTPILATKLHIPPPRPGIVPRPHLIEWLTKGLHRRLTLVSAPAGFGKTTLVGEWAASFERSVAWLSLDEGDNDTTRFLAHLIAALQTVAASVGAGLLGVLQSPQPPPIEAVLAALINQIATVPDRLVLVLDDYHVIDAERVESAIAFLLEHLPPQMHLVIATREDPDLPLARWRARDQVTELRATNLRFTSSEASQFLNQVMCLSLSAGEIAALETRTEGWIAGLQLAALSMQGRSDTASFIHAFAGSHRFVLDYLVEEVLQHQPERVRSFLLQTAILDRLSGPLCNAVTGRDDGAVMLDALERGNLFIVPLDDERQWYRYHHLFADVLQARLVEEQPNQVSGLHRRASSWYERSGLPPDAIRHALAAKDFERSASLIELAWSEMDVSMRSATWLGWARALPDELVRARPVLSVGWAWALLDGGEMEACEARLRDAERWLDTSEDTQERPETASDEMVVADERQFRSLRATIATARAYRALALSDVPGTVKYARQALRHTPEEDHVRRIQATALLGLAQHAGGQLEAADRSLADLQANTGKAGDISTAIGMTHVLADVRVARGRLHGAMSAYQQAMQLAAAHGEPMPVGTADLCRGISELCCERGDADAAAEHLMASKKLGEHAVLTGLQSRLCVAEARIREAGGDLDGALDSLDEAERLYVRSPLPDVRPIAALRAQIWVAQGRLTEALGWVHERGLSPGDDLCYLREFEHMTLARVLIARYKTGRADTAVREALTLLERLLKAAEEGERMGSLIEILALQALAHEAQGGTHAALAPLERALTLAEPEGYVRVFVHEGPPMAALLREAAKRAIAPNYVARLRAAFGQAEGRTPVTQLLVEPLSERELEVLGLLRTELSGPEIARELTVSLSTVRTHTQNIYTKLGVGNRRAAVRRAEAIGLL